MKLERTPVVTMEMVQAVNGDDKLDNVSRLRLQLEDPESETGYRERDFVCVEGARKADILTEMRHAGMHWEGDPFVDDVDARPSADLRDIVAADADRTIPTRESVTLRAQLQGAVDQFNICCPVGTPVLVMMDDGSMVEATVTNEATILGGHTAVGWFSGISGCYKLDRARKL